MANFFINLLISFLFPVLFAFVGNALEWLFNMFTKPFNFTATAFIGLLGKDLPNIIINLMISFGIGIATIIFLISLYKVFFAGTSSKIESPISMSFRFVGSIFLCYWLIDIMYELVFPLFQFFLDKVTSITVKDGTSITEKVASIFNFQDVESSFKSLGSFAIDASSIGSFSRILFLILFIILLFMIISNIIKLVGEIIERYLLINILTLFSPLVAATAVSKTTMPIFISWCQMMIANGLVIIFNALGFIMVHVAFVNLSLENVNDIGNIIVSFFAISALIKVVQKFDTYLAQLTFKIQAINSNGGGLSVGKLFSPSNINKQAEKISSAGGIKSYVGSQASNLLGVFGGNHSGFAGDVGKSSRMYKATNTAEEKAVGGLNFASSNAGKAVDLKKMDNQIKNLDDPDYIQKNAELANAKAKNGTAVNNAIKNFEPLVIEDEDYSLNDDSSFNGTNKETFDGDSMNNSQNGDVDALNMQNNGSGVQTNVKNTDSYSSPINENSSMPEGSLSTGSSVEDRSQNNNLTKTTSQNSAHINKSSSSYFEQPNSAMERTKNYLNKNQNTYKPYQGPYDSSQYEPYRDPEQKSNERNSKKDKK